MTVPYIGDELTPVVMRVTKGADRKFTLRRHDADDNPADWDADLFIGIDINATTSTRVQATVVGEVADFHVESEVLDRVKKAATWQIVMSQAGSPTLETPLMVGTFERQDGK